MYREEIPYTEIAPAAAGQRLGYWQVARDLQRTDGLVVSDYAESVARGYVAGDLDAVEAAAVVEHRYAEAVTIDAEADPRQPEADIVSMRMLSLLESGGFSLSPATLLGIHRRLFDGVLPAEWVGCFRKVNLTKAEPVLAGRTVTYADWSMIQDTLAYDFGLEAKTPYAAPFDQAQVGRFAWFISNVWQVHPFREGNTRTVALFAQLYLRTLGVEATNSPFREHSTYFRDALVRANFASIPEGIEEDQRFIQRFFENLILDAGHPLVEADLNLHGHRLDGGVPYRA